MAKTVTALNYKYKCTKCGRMHYYGSWIYFQHITYGGCVVRPQVTPLVGGNNATLQ